MAFLALKVACHVNVKHTRTLPPHQNHIARSLDDKRVTAAELGTAHMEDLALNQLKKEKLWAKDKLARIMNESGS